MKKTLILSTLLASMLLVVGCGGSSSADSAAEILKGKTFYYTDNELDDENGYYQDDFNDTTFTETEYDSDSNELFSESMKISYSGSQITLTDEEGDEETCSVKRADKSVEISCPNNGFIQILWDTIEDAKANPQPD